MAKNKLDPKSIFQKTSLYWLLAALAFLVYGNTLTNDYALDDWLVTTSKHDQVSRGLEALPEIFTTHYVTWGSYQVDYRPLVKASFALEFELFGENPKISHAINLVLYAIICCLLFSLLLQFFPAEQKWVLFSAMLIFIVHPVHTEVVASLKNRDELLSFLFILLVFQFSLKWFTYRTRKYVGMTILFLVLSLLSKMSSLPWLGILVAWLLWYNGESKKRVIMLAGAMLVVIAAYQVMVLSMLGDWLREFIFIETPYFQIDSAADKWASIISAAGHYLSLLVYPFPLCSYYGYNQIPIVSWSHWSVYASIAAYLGLIVLAIRGLRFNNMIGFGAMVLLFDLALFVNVLYPYTGILGERVLFGGTIGFALMVTGALQLVIGKAVNGDLLPRQLPASVLIIAMVVLAGYRTVARNKQWKSNLTLFAADVEDCPRSAKLHELYALYLRGEYMNKTVNDWKPLAYKAISEYQETLSIYERWPVPYHRIGVIYQYDMLRPDSALAYYQNALKYNPNFSIARQDYAICLMDLKRFPEAAKQFSKIIDDGLNEPEIWNRAVSCDLLSNDLESAKDHNSRFLIEYPSRSEPYIHAGNLLLSQKDTVKAIARFNQALDRDPVNTALREYVEMIAR
ncbi:MAG: tetratricopeptide repeat protein [Flavobacteriales bacterium]|nr:tetratricopeptide repeat protein [Flavobacteriales bacterium]